MQDGHGELVCCPVCRREKPGWEMIPGEAMSRSLAAIVEQQHPGWSVKSQICATCLAQCRNAFAAHVLETEPGEMQGEVHDLNDGMPARDPNDKDIDAVLKRHRTPGEYIADTVTNFVGSWGFFTANIIFLAIWMVINSLAIFTFHFDPYPFIFLNLVVSWISVLEAPLIMMSQNRQDDRDRLRDEHDYNVNLAAETEIRMLHRKLDQLLLEHWPRLVEIQRLQMELLEQTARNAQPPAEDE